MMQSVKLQSWVGEDGILRLELPVMLKNMGLELLIVFQPIIPTKPDPVDLGWPVGYFEQICGSFKDDPLERPPQGEFEVREILI